VTFSAPPDTFPSQNDTLSFPDLAPIKPLTLLIRATNGKHKSKVSISTVVTADNMESFFTRYTDVCKAGMSGLKKRDRSKAKARQKAKKKVSPPGEEKK
jgi:signal recognition particle subunit SRP14